MQAPYRRTSAELASEPRFPAKARPADETLRTKKSFLFISAPSSFMPGLMCAPHKAAGINRTAGNQRALLCCDAVLHLLLYLSLVYFDIKRKCSFTTGRRTVRSASTSGLSVFDGCCEQSRRESPPLRGSKSTFDKR